jgi:hypothetical protein
LGLNHKDYMGANYGPTSQLRAKKIKWATLASFGGQLRPLLWASLASFNFIYFLFYFIFLRPKTRRNGGRRQPEVAAEGGIGPCHLLG